MAETLVRVGAQLQKSSTPSSILYTDGANDPAWFPPSPGSDKILFYDDSSNSIAWLSPNINISISGTNLNATAGAGGMTTTQEEGVEVSATNSVLNFIGSAITAADAGSGVTSITMDSFINTLATQGSIDLTADVTGLLPFANIANGLSLSVFGRSTNSDGVMASIQAASDHQVLRRSGTSIAFGAVNLSQSAAVTNVLQYNNGGTGQSAWAEGDILYASALNTPDLLNIGTVGQVLQSDGALPSWETLDSSDLSDNTNIAYLDANNVFTGNNTFNNAITASTTPTDPTHLTNKAYVDALVMDLVKHKADVVSDSNLTLSGEQTIDDVLTSTSRVLLTGQTDLSENGIWLTGAGAWTRVTDFNEESEVNEGLVIVLPGGTTYSNTIWTTVADIATIDTDDIEFIKLNSPFSIVAGDGLTLTVDTIDLVAADTSLTINANDVAINLASNSGLEISTGLKILPDTTTANTLALTLTANGAGVKYNSTAFSESAEALTLANTVAGDGLDLTSQVLSVKVDDSTIEIDTDTLQVKDSGITYAKIQDVTEDRLLGRNAGGDGPVQEITIGSGLAWGSNDATINHADTSSVSNVNTAGPEIVDTITFDTYGHITAITTRDITLNDLDDVTITSAQDGDVLVYDTGVWVNQQEGSTVTHGYIENQSGTTFDLDANDGSLKDVDGTNVVMTVAAVNEKMHVYKNGQRLHQTGSLTTRDYDFGAGETITFAVALTTADRVLIEKWG